MSISLILSLTTLVLLLATAGCGIAIAVLERNGVVPPSVERTFIGLAGTGSAVLVSAVVALHPLAGGAVVHGFNLPSVTGVALAAEIDAAGMPPCVSLAGGPAYDRGDARSEGDRTQGDSGHEVSLFRSSRPR